MSSSELQGWSLVEGKQNFWQIFVPCSLFIIIIFLVILQLLQRRRRRKNKIEQMQPEMQMILKEDKSYKEVVRSTIAVIIVLHMFLLRCCFGTEFNITSLFYAYKRYLCQE
jgi:Na+/H+ antiporter NhaD/arsenite permease-like protein